MKRLRSAAASLVACGILLTLTACSGVKGAPQASSHPADPVPAGPPAAETTTPPPLPQALQPAAPAPDLLARACREGRVPAGSPDLPAAITDVVRAQAGSAQAVQAALAQAMGEGARPAAANADVDGDGRPDLIITFGWCTGPVLVYRAVDQDRPVLLPLDANGFWGPGGGSRLDQVADLTGDGRPEMVLVFTVAGASAGHEFIRLLTWRENAFVELFSEHVSNWRGPNRWAVGKDGVTTQCRPIGPYEHKLSESRQQTEWFNWNPQLNRYELVRRTREPVATRLQQVSAAEALFQQGDYEGAAAEFRQVAGLPAASPNARHPDWIAYSHLRLGQIAALQGQRAGAMAALSLAEAGQWPMGEMAQIFRAAYADGDAAQAFTALWLWVKVTARVPGQPNVQTDTWPFMLDIQTLGARTAMLHAYSQAGRTPPDDLPEAASFDEPDCLKISY